jgi:hypothetical protein
MKRIVKRLSPGCQPMKKIKHGEVKAAFRLMEILKQK